MVKKQEEAFYWKWSKVLPVNGLKNYGIEL